MAPSIDLTRAVRFVNFSTKAKDQEGQPICFDAASLEGIYDVTAEEGAVTCYLSVGLRHRNFMGNLHGGCTGEPGRAVEEGIHKGCTGGTARTWGHKNAIYNQLPSLIPPSQPPWWT